MTSFIVNKGKGMKEARKGKLKRETKMLFVLREMYGEKKTSGAALRREYARDSWKHQLSRVYHIISDGLHIEKKEKKEGE